MAGLTDLRPKGLSNLKVFALAGQGLTGGKTRFGAPRRGSGGLSFCRTPTLAVGAIGQGTAPGLADRTVISSPSRVPYETPM